MTMPPGERAAIDQSAAVMTDKFGFIAGAADNLDQAEAVRAVSLLLQLTPQMDRGTLAAGVAVYAVQARRQADTLARGRRVELHADSIRVMRDNLAGLPWWAWRRRQNIRHQLAVMAVAVVDPHPAKVRILLPRAAE